MTLKRSRLPRGAGKQASGSPAKKRTKLRPVGLGKRWKAELDRLCREVVFARDECCQWCQRMDGQFHWAHVRSRRYLSTRWDLGNSLRLCAGCHLRWHHQPLAAVEWFNTAFPKRAERLKYFDTGATTGKVDKEVVRLYLDHKLKEYGP